MGFVRHLRLHPAVIVGETLFFEGYEDTLLELADCMGETQGMDKFGWFYQVKYIHMLYVPLGEKDE